MKRISGLFIIIAIFCSPCLAEANTRTLPVLDGYDYAISIPPHSTSTIVLPALCLDFSKKTPETTTGFGSVPQESAPLVKRLYNMHENMLLDQPYYTRLFSSIPSLKILAETEHETLTLEGFYFQMPYSYKKYIDEALQAAIWNSDPQYKNKTGEYITSVNRIISHNEAKLDAIRYRASRETIKEIALQIMEYKFVLKLMDAIEKLGQRMYEVASQEPSKNEDIVTAVASRTLSEKISKLRPTIDESFVLYSASPFIVASRISRERTEMCVTRSIQWTHKQMMANFCDKFPESGTVVIYLFDQLYQYTDYVEKNYGQSGSGTVGIAIGNDLLVHIGSGTGTLVHELVHAYMQSDFPQIPVWFNEGLASLYEQSAEVDGKITGFVNWRLPVVSEAIKNNSVIPFKNLFQASRADFNGKQAGLYYAESRYLCLYLQERGVLKDFYRQFRSNYQTDPTGELTLLSVLQKESLGQVQADWIKFIQGIR